VKTTLIPPTVLPAATLDTCASGSASKRQQSHALAIAVGGIIGGMMLVSLLMYAFSGCRKGKAEYHLIGE
jgi:hypothetical protein